MADIFLIKDWDKKLFRHLWSPTNHTIYALSPMAAYYLDALGIEFHTLGEFSIWSKEKSYFQKVENFFEGIFGPISKRYPNSDDIPITYHCYTMLRNVLDSFVRNHYFYKQLIEREKPNNIYYLSGLEKDHIDYELYFKTKSVFAMICEEYSKLGNAEFKPTYFCTDQYPVQPTWKDNKIIRSSYDFFRCYKFLPSWKFTDPILFASTIPNRIREAKKQGYKVEVLKDPGINRYQSFKLAEFRGFVEQFYDTFSERYVALILLLDRIVYFINHIVPTIYAYADYYEREFKRKKYKLIAFDRRNHLYQYGALIAARRVGLKSLYFRHGWDAYDIEDRADKWLRCFDYFMSDVEIDVEVFREIRDKKGYKSKVIGGENVL